MLNVRLAGGHLYWKQLFTWLSLVVSLMASFVLSFFPTRCLGWDLGLNWVSFWGISYLLLWNSASCLSVIDKCMGLFKRCQSCTGWSGHTHFSQVTQISTQIKLNNAFVVVLNPGRCLVLNNAVLFIYYSLTQQFKLCALALVLKLFLATIKHYFCLVSYFSKNIILLSHLL